MSISQMDIAFKDAVLPRDAIQSLRDLAVEPHISHGMAQLFSPQDTPDLVCTTWFAAKWCHTHKEWTWKAL